MKITQQRVLNGIFILALLAIEGWCLPHFILDQCPCFRYFLGGILAVLSFGAILGGIVFLIVRIYNNDIVLFEPFEVGKRDNGERELMSKIVDAKNRGDDAMEEELFTEWQKKYGR